MVVAKTELFEKELQECAEIFKALAHPARLQILKYLAETKICITGDISDEIPLSRTTVNQHLKELKKNCRSALKFSKRLHILHDYRS